MRTTPLTPQRIETYSRISISGHRKSSSLGKWGLKLEAALETITAAPGAQDDAIEKFKELAHEMRGFGGTFDYNLITAISDQLFRVMEQFKGINAQQAMIIKVHIDSMKVVSTERIKGDGGERGEQVMSGLRSVIAKFT
ncbi:MAG: hypothetical protein HN650_14810 [Rhodospirillaceae bacterium]|nr:hypothetical protein [Rhodospirillaceae bacterium]